MNDRRAQVSYRMEDGIMAMEITNNYSNVEQANAEKEMQAKAPRKETEKKVHTGAGGNIQNI